MSVLSLHFQRLTLCRRDDPLNIYLVLSHQGERTEHEFRPERQTPSAASSPVRCPMSALFELPVHTLR